MKLFFLSIVTFLLACGSATPTTTQAPVQPANAGAQHAFMNPENKSGYDDAAAKDAWTRIDAFFSRTLKGGA